LENNSSDDGAIVLKFGSWVLRTRADLPNAVHEIYRWYRRASRSSPSYLRSALHGRAFGRSTGHLRATRAVRHGRALSYRRAHLDGALGPALDRSGIPARVLNPREVRLIALGSPLDSELLSVNTGRLRQLLTIGCSSFRASSGMDLEGRAHLLGRGGWDAAVSRRPTKQAPTGEVCSL
jgi:hypothetical protein